MPEYRVELIERDSGKWGAVTIQAESESAARKRALRDGWLIGDVRLVPEPTPDPPPPPRSAPPAARTPICQQCGGAMQRATAKRNEAAGCVLAILVFLAGVVIFFLIPVIGWVAGALLCIFAILIPFHSDRVWRCTDCRAIVPRG